MVTFLVSVQSAVLPDEDGTYAHGWYFRNIGWKALMGGVIGLAILWLSHILVAGAANLII